MKTYQYFFYSRYKYWLTKEKWKDSAHISAIFDLALISIISLITIVYFLYLYVFYRKPNVDFGELFNFVYVGSLLGIMLVLHYYFLIRKKRYIQIFNYFENLPKKEIIIFRFFYYFYFFIIILMFLSLIFYNKII